MLRYRVDSYTRDNAIGETTGMVTLWDHLGTESASQPFSVPSIDGETVVAHLMAMAKNFDDNNIAIAEAAAASSTIAEITVDEIEEFDDDLTPGTAVVTGVVFIDNNMNGIRDDVGRLAGVDVEMYLSANDELIDTDTTNANGIYTLSNVEGAEYYLKFNPPAGYVITLQDQGEDDTLDSDVNPSTGYTESFVVENDTNVTGIDCGVYAVASVSGKVFIDGNQDGLSTADSGMLGTTVELYSLDDVLKDTTTTDASGLYAFDTIDPRVLPACYVKVTAPFGYVFSAQDVGEDDTIDSDVDTTTGKSANFNLIPGSDITNVDAGIYQLIAHVTGSIFDDWDRDGTWDTPDEALSSISTTVEICYAVNDVVANSAVITDGDYDLTVAPGNEYYVKITPATYWEISPLAGDNDVDPVTSKSATFTPNAGDTVTKDVGLMHERGYVDAHVFIDDGAGGGTADNGTQDGTEANSLGVEVYLRVTNPQGGFWDAYPDPVTGDIHLLVHTGINLTAAWNFVGGYATGYHMTNLLANPETGITVTKGGTTDLGDRGIAAD